MSASATVNAARFDELTPGVLYQILKLRSDIFVVEQSCVFSDMDGRDIEPETLHLWIADNAGDVVAALRILRNSDGVKHIGRVVTRIDQRRRGLSERLMRHALEMSGRPVEVKAQSRLEHWYGKLGFVRRGDDWIEDGIPHIRMVLEA